MKDKIIINNRKLISAKNHRRLNETFNTISQLGANVERSFIKVSK